MLMLVAAVLVYDLAYEPVVDLTEGLEARDTLSFALSLKARSETNDEKDIVGPYRAGEAYSDGPIYQL